TQVLELNYTKKTRLRSTKTKVVVIVKVIVVQKITYSHSSFETLQPPKVSRRVQKESKDLPTWFSPSSKDSARPIFFRNCAARTSFLEEKQGQSLPPNSSTHR
ncbi:hypothetical protein TorRG33x02_155770, partial [Trema orientale]